MEVSFERILRKHGVNMNWLRQNFLNDGGPVMVGCSDLISSWSGVHPKSDQTESDYTKSCQFDEYDVALMNTNRGNILVVGDSVPSYRTFWNGQNTLLIAMLHAIDEELLPESALCSELSRLAIPDNGTFIGTLDGTSTNLIFTHCATAGVEANVVATDLGMIGDAFQFTFSSPGPWRVWAKLVNFDGAAEVTGVLISN